METIRSGEVTFKDKPVDLIGPKIKTGEKAPDFTVVGKDLALISLKNTSGKARLFSVVPSLDTPVCNIQTKRFAQELKALGDSVAAYTVSLDMPFSQARFCKEADIENIQNLSDMHNQSFGRNYGVLIKGLPVPLLARAIFVVDAEDMVRHVEIVPQVGQEPNYETAMTALKVAANA